MVYDYCWDLDNIGACFALEYNDTEHIKRTVRSYKLYTSKDLSSRHVKHLPWSESCTFATCRCPSEQLPPEL